MEMMEGAWVAFGIRCLVVAFCLWLGSIITGAHGSFIGMVVIAVISAFCGMAPGIWGTILPVVVMYFLIWKLLRISFFPDTLLLVIVAGVISHFSMIFWFPR